MRRFFNWKLTVSFAIVLGLCLLLDLRISSSAASFISNATTIKIYATPLGASTRYIGACEGDMGFSRADLIDLNLNTYRIYGGMSRWEMEDDDGTYGSPSIEQIKANPNLVNWEWWDRAMSSPEGGSDYHFSGVPEERWQGNARTIFETLKDLRVLPVVTIRNSDPGRSPGWALQLNPPRTEADWNEWWEHVFATVYWLNVRNDYQVDHWEVHNEPDNLSQGWGGNHEDYSKLVRVTADAISHVYTTYLPNREYHIHAPKTVGGSLWPKEMLATAPAYFDNVNVHNYDLDVSSYVQQVRGWMRDSIHAGSPLWLGEWGTYTTGYDELEFSLNLIKNLIHMSQPGDSYVYGSHIFSLYNWGKEPYFEGLIDTDGTRRLSYYAFRMGIRALQGGRDVMLATSTNPRVMAIATQDDYEKLFLLIVNQNSEDYVANADVSALKERGQTKVWEFSETHLDTIIEESRVTSGHLPIHIPAYSSQLIVVE